MKRALLTGFVLMLIVLVFGSGLFIWQLVNAHDAVEHLSGDLYRVLDGERRLTDHLDTIQTELYLLSGGRRRYADELIAVVEKLEQLLAELSRHYAVAAHTDIHRKLRERLAGLKNVASRMATTDDPGLFASLAQQCLSVSIMFRQEASHLRREIAEHVREDVIGSRAAGHNIIISFVVIFWVVVVTFLVVMRRTLAFLMQGISRLVSGAQAIARGDFSQRIEVPKGRELQELARAMNTMANDLAQAEERRVAAVRQLVVSLNHEFNNRISAIVTLADWLKRHWGRRDPEATEKLDEIRSSGHEISNLLHRLAGLERLVTKEYMRGVAMLDIGNGRADDQPTTATPE